MARGSMWTEKTMHAGQYSFIRDLLAAGTHEVVVHGPASEGWQVSLCSKAMPNIFMPVSPLFHRDYGDTRRDCMEACERVYGVQPRVSRGTL